MCTFGLSGCRVKPRRPHGFATHTRRQQKVYVRLRPISTSANFDFGQFRLRPISTSANFDFGPISTSANFDFGQLAEVELSEVELAEVEHPPLGRRGFAVESAVAQICREGGARCL